MFCGGCAGPLADFDLPVDSFTKQCKGFAHVVYMMPEHAVQAFAELDGKTFMVRNYVSMLGGLRSHCRQASEGVHARFSFM